jgi:Putative lumazine-binding
MKNSHILFLGLCVSLSILTMCQPSPAPASVSEDEQAIKSLIQRSYLNGAFNGLDTKSMAEGFHPDFAIYYPDSNTVLGKFTLKEWISGIDSSRSDPKFDPKTRAFDGKIISIDITGEAASIKMELSQNQKLVYTDYMTLLRFGKSWKIVAKVYHEHE